MLLTPVLSATLAALLYWLVARLLPEATVSSSGICVCEEQPAHSAGAATVAASATADLRVGTTQACKNAGATEMS